MKQQSKMKKSAGDTSAESLSNRKMRWWALLLPLVALVVIGVGLLSYESVVLFRAQELNLFLYTPLFFKQQMVVAGGALAYLSTYFQQYFYYPWLGVTLLCLWWALLMWLVKKAFAVSDRWAVLLLIPVALLLIANVDQGYWLFYLKERGHYFAGTIGTTLAVAMVWGYRAIANLTCADNTTAVARRPWAPALRWLYLAVAAVVGYPLVGFYALLALVIMAFMALGDGFGHRRPWKHCSLDVAIAVLLVIAVPIIFYRAVYYETILHWIWFVGLPIFVFSEVYTAYYIPYILLAVFFVVLALVGGVGQRASKGKPTLWLLSQVVLLAVLAGCTWHFWYHDENYHKEIAMNRCIENCDWEGVLSIARDEEGEPSRMMWMMKNLALFRLGRQGDEMYRFKQGDRKPDAPFNVHMTQTGGKLIYLHYGKLNFCYRWCLEDGVEFGWRVDFYRFMLRCALLNGEYAVAQKYIDILKQTKYYVDYAEEMERLVANHSLIAQREEFKPILRMKEKTDYLTSDNTLIELFLLNTFAYSDSDDKLYQECCLLSALQNKDIPSFWGRFFRYAQQHVGERMPIHYQEAAYLYGHLENKVDISRMPFDSTVVQSYNDLMQAVQGLQGMSEEDMGRALHDRYAGTFYYDYFFVRNQKSY